MAKVTLDAGVAIGSRLFVALYGFEPNADVPLAFYADTGARETDDLCTDNCTRFELLDDLGLFSTDGLGTSLRELDIDDRFEPGRAYCITSPLVDRGFCDSFGPGWFVVN